GVRARAGAAVTTRLYLVRHGEPDDAWRGRCYGRLDVGLSPSGRAQAERTAAWLGAAPIAAVYASPLRRALESAAPIAAAHGLTPVAVRALREIDFGQLEGLSYDEAAERHPELYRAWMERPTEVSFPGGESYADMRERVQRAVLELRRQAAAAAAATAQ